MRDTTSLFRDVPVTDSAGLAVGSQPAQVEFGYEKLPCLVVEYATFERLEEGTAVSVGPEMVRKSRTEW